MQHGRISYDQLRGCGLGRGAIDHASRPGGRLLRVHVGVYALGHQAPSDHGRWIGAVLSCGADAALGVRSAGRLWRIDRGEGPRVDVIVPTRNGRDRDDVEIHRAALPPEEVTVRDGIRVTTVARTIVDLSHERDEAELRGVVREAQFLRLFNLAATRAAAARWPSRGLNDIIEDMVGSSSRLDDGFKRLIRRHCLPKPKAQAKVFGHRFDYVWEKQRVAVELDGFKAHVSLDAFQRDRSQGNELQLARWILLRFTWDDVFRREARTAGRLWQALGG